MGQVSFTLDIWSDRRYGSYLAITAHWIAEVEGSRTLQLKTSLIAFHHLRRQNHSGKLLAKVVRYLLDQAGVTKKVRRLCYYASDRHAHPFKVRHFTTDNASNNKTMMAELQMMLTSHDIAFDANKRRVMCFAYIINLCSGRVIHATTNGVEDKDAPSSSDNDSDSPFSSCDVPHAPNPIEAACAAVRAIQGSGQHRSDFSKVITSGNTKGWFKGQQLNDLQLLRDVHTRWHSIYYMLE